MIGVALLVHEQFGRAGQLARHLAEQGCRVAIHVDRRSPDDQTSRLMSRLAGNDRIVFAPRLACDWGTYSLVEATLGTVRLLFQTWPDLTHVVQISGSCLPIRPVAALQQHLAENPETDFIESVPVEVDRWVVGGLAEERFTLYHPFSWRRHRRLFDLSVEIQRKLKISRRLPDGLAPHIGSQWWCLSSGTLRAILDDPRLDEYCRVFRTTWIPDESFFQTLARKHATRVVSAPLTFVKFDPQGKPFVFYDDHMEMLLNAEAFFARKIWHGANGLYSTFLGPELETMQPAERRPEMIRERLAEAQLLRTDGRSGLLSQGRYPRRHRDGRYQTARPYVVLDGLADVLPDLDAALSGAGMIAHGALYHPERVEFAGGTPVFCGNIAASPAIRDYNPDGFLVNLLWIRRDKAQSFHLRMAPTARVSRRILRDPNARILRLAERWLIELFRTTASGAPSAGIAAAVAAARAEEADLVAMIERESRRAQVLTLSLADLLDDSRGTAGRMGKALPLLTVDLSHAVAALRIPDGFAAFLRGLDAGALALPGLPELAERVERHEKMASVLRRKT